MGAGAAALFGISFGLLPALLLLSALAIYDAISVYGTEHMLDLAEGVMDLKIPVVLVVPLTLSYSYRAAGSTDDVLEDGGTETEPHDDPAGDALGDDATDGDAADPDDTDAAADAGSDADGALDRDALFIGLGDAVIPTVLVASAAAFLDAGTLSVPVLAVNLPALGAAVGTIAGLLALMYMVLEGRAHAGLPLLNGGAIGGYLLGALASGSRSPPRSASERAPQSPIRCHLSWRLPEPSIRLDSLLAAVRTVLDEIDLEIVVVLETANQRIDPRGLARHDVGGGIHGGHDDVVVLVVALDDVENDIGLVLVLQRCRSPVRLERKALAQCLERATADGPFDREARVVVLNAVGDLPVREIAHRVEIRVTDANLRRREHAEHAGSNRLVAELLGRQVDRPIVRADVTRRFDVLAADAFLVDPSSRPPVLVAGLGGRFFRDARRRCRKRRHVVDTAEAAGRRPDHAGRERADELPSVHVTHSDQRRTDKRRGDLHRLMTARSALSP